MRSTSLKQHRQVTSINRLIDLSFTVLVFSIFFVALFYLFDKGAVFVAEIVVNISPLEPW